MRDMSDLRCIGEIRPEIVVDEWGGMWYNTGMDSNRP
jgi:hypothetical protein